jgi:hypothetical protein
MCDSLCYSYAVQRDGHHLSASTPVVLAADKAVVHAARFLPVRDSRKQKIRGLWRHGRKVLRAQLRMEAGGGQTKPKRIPLSAVNLESGPRRAGKGPHCQSRRKASTDRARSGVRGFRDAIPCQSDSRTEKGEHASQ